MLARTMKYLIKTYTYLNLVFLFDGVLGKIVLCKEPKQYRVVEVDAVVVDNVIASYNVRVQAECCLYCEQIEYCKSYNYQYKENGGLQLCEINNTTMESCPRTRMQKEGHSYFRDINVHPLQVYGSRENPGRSCLDIGRCRDKDGEYWINSEETGLLKVFCYIDVTNASNLASNKLTNQSRTSHGAPSSRAVDGNRDSDFSGLSCSNTASVASPWWRVDLQNVYFIRELIITNRGDCCSERLSNFEIRIGLNLTNNGNDNPQCGDKHSLLKETKKIVCSPPLVGRYVNIVIPYTTSHLTLCEVEVYP